MATNFLARVKSRPRFALAILFVGACAYAIHGWFFTRVNRQQMDWIELPDYQQAMKELQRRSVIWGDVALVLGIVAFALILPPRANSVHNWSYARYLVGNSRREHLDRIFRSIRFSCRNHLLRGIWPRCYDSVRLTFHRFLDSW